MNAKNAKGGTHLNAKNAKGGTHLYRSAKVAAVGIALLLGAIVEEFTAVRVLSFFTIVLALVWIGIARYAGDQFQAMTEDS